MHRNGWWGFRDLPCTVPHRLPWFSSPVRWARRHGSRGKLGSLAGYRLRTQVPVCRFLELHSPPPANLLPSTRSSLIAAPPSGADVAANLLGCSRRPCHCRGWLGWEHRGTRWAPTGPPRPMWRSSRNCGQDDHIARSTNVVGREQFSDGTSNVGYEAHTLQKAVSRWRDYCLTTCKRRIALTSSDGRLLYLFHHIRSCASS